MSSVVGFKEWVAEALPALQRAADFVTARQGYALSIATEVCSAAYFLDNDPETAVGNALCGDGAAACVSGPSFAGSVICKSGAF